MSSMAVSVRRNRFNSPLCVAADTRSLRPQRWRPLSGHKAARRRYYGPSVSAGPSPESWRKWNCSVWSRYPPCQVRILFHFRYRYLPRCRTCTSPLLFTEKNTNQLPIAAFDNVWTVPNDCVLFCMCALSTLVLKSFFVVFVYFLPVRI